MKRTFIFALFVALALLNGVQKACAGENDGVLTNASAVLALSGDQAAQALKVSICGVVTAAEATWGGRFFIQDSSGGFFVENISSNQPLPGDVLTLTGVTFPGGYAPTISKPHWKKIGRSPLPFPKPVAIEELEHFLFR